MHRTCRRCANIDSVLFRLISERIDKFNFRIFHLVLDYWYPLCHCDWTMWSWLVIRGVPREKRRRLCFTPRIKEKYWLHYLYRYYLLLFKNSQTVIYVPEFIACMAECPNWIPLGATYVGLVNKNSK